MSLLATADLPANLWPLAVLGISLAAIVVMITVLRIHAFIALIFSAILTGLLAQQLPARFESLPDGTKILKSHWVRAAELSADGFGATASKIGVVIALAAMIGVCLARSGAADCIMRRFLALLGERRAAHAIFISGYILSIPIFFETYFMLLLPLAQALHVRTGRDYMLYVLAICCGGTITHSLVAPHPGPLAMAENLHLDVGQTIVAGILAGIIPATCAWLLSQRIARRVAAPMRETAARAELEAFIAKPGSELPSLALSLTAVLLPLVLIGAVSLLGVLGARTAMPSVFPWIEFLGERHVALLIGAVFAMGVLMHQRRIGFGKVSEFIGPEFKVAGVIVLIASAGGAYGGMLRNAGVGDAAAALAKQWDLNLVFFAWLLSAIIRVAQGSATVAMITASAILAPMVAAAPLPYHPIYIFLAIGFGSKMISWMNDSGFWTVSERAGFTEKETLQSWTLLVTCGSLVGLVQCLLFSRWLPLVP